MKRHATRQPQRTSRQAAKPSHQAGGSTKRHETSVKKELPSRHGHEVARNEQTTKHRQASGAKQNQSASGKRQLEGRFRQETARNGPDLFYSSTVLFCCCPFLLLSCCPAVLLPSCSSFSVLIWLLPFSCCRAVLLFSCPAVVLFCCPVVLLSCCPAAFLSYCSLFFFLLLSCPLSSCPCCSAVLQSFCQASCPRIESKSGHTTKRKCTKHRSCNAKDHTDLPKPTLCADICDFFSRPVKIFSSFEF